MAEVLLFLHGLIQPQARARLFIVARQQALTSTADFPFQAVSA
jgi:hypothetical protein